MMQILDETAIILVVAPIMIAEETGKSYKKLSSNNCLMISGCLFFFFIANYIYRCCQYCQMFEKINNSRILIHCYMLLEIYMGVLKNYLPSIHIGLVVGRHIFDRSRMNKN